jgi:hypothetical protein
MESATAPGQSLGSWVPHAFAKNREPVIGQLFDHAARQRRKIRRRVLRQELQNGDFEVIMFINHVETSHLQQDRLLIRSREATLLHEIPATPPL